MEVVETRELPWGREEVLWRGQSVAVKLITVRPGQRSSLQRHAKRSESWAVLSTNGGRIRIGGEELAAQEGASFEIPLGALHRYTAPPDAALVLLEVWHGESDQDDIERLEDDYGRA